MTATMSIDPASLVRPRRVITGMSAILLPMKADLTVDTSRQTLPQSFQNLRAAARQAMGLKA
jgi:XRE family aerobic/anaerobic benzoate catabolism transcriptional regulator